jgi:hypothetical protein
MTSKGGSVDIADAVDRKVCLYDDSDCKLLEAAVNAKLAPFNWQCEILDCSERAFLFPK